MCRIPSEPLPETLVNSVSYHKRTIKTRNHPRIPRLCRRRRVWRKNKSRGREIEIENRRLYMENQNIIRENERLMEKALLLHQENQALFSLLQTKLSHVSTSP
ncbi:PREDICTED: protein LITTLE ZIPPER 1 [Tarenaya hassleriana]|uniref:protein LITTLE ZIPPER 1 n=1 Tax=Tarenaya hassleriana TaxID=28532 RepID=UPI00053C8ACF|nr:PREDICTED: protein LITTLE ZIPPER 1 [Tarenaya hassleriana]